MLVKRDVIITVCIYYLCCA